eukprot:COSAG02_NODE_48793_length_331_cov_0.879310_1_plen_61_part_01
MQCNHPTLLPEALRHGGSSLLAQILCNRMQPVDVVQEKVGVMTSTLGARLCHVDHILFDEK